MPPAGVPLVFLAAAGVGLVGFGVALTLVASTAVVAPNAPAVVAAVHLGMLAFLSTAVLGAMHQFAPVIAARPLHSTRAAYATAAVFVPAVWTLALGFATGNPGVVSAGGAVAFCGIALAVWNLSGPLSARGKGTTVLGLRLALGFLVLTAAFGVTYAFDRQASWFGLLPRRVLAHAHLGLLGWLGLAYVAVAEKLWPMFLLAHRPGSRTGDWAVRLLPTGAAVLAAGLLIPNKPVAVAGGLLAGAGLASHLASLAGVIRHRRRPLELLHASPSSPPPPASPLRSPARPPAPPSSSASAAPPSPPPASSPSRTSASARSGPPPTTPKAKGANHDVRPATRRLP